MPIESSDSPEAARVRPDRYDPAFAFKPADSRTLPTDALAETLPSADALAVRTTTRQLHREVWSLAWPSVATMLLQTVNGLLDVFFVGRLPNSAQALAATGVGGQVIFLLISLAMGVSVGTTALVARFTGARNTDDAMEATGQSLTLSFLLALGFGALFYVGRFAIVGWQLNGDNEAATARLCAQFLSLALLATVPMFVMNVLMAAFRGLGDTRTPMLIQTLVITTHITGNLLLINGLAGLPRMGAPGAGLAFAISIFVGCALYLVALVKRTPLRDALQPRYLRLRSSWAGRILKIGIPASIQAVIRTLGMMSFTGMLARSLDGASGVAALQIGVRAESIAFMPGFGYSVAAAALVGQSLGARDPDRAERYGWAATGQAIVVMIVMACVFFTFASPLASLFTRDPHVQRLGADYLRINAFCEPFLALGMVLTGALQGAGDTLLPTAITFVTMWLARLPLTYWLVFKLNWQARGAWVAMMVTTIIGGLLTFSLFRLGRWKRIKV